MTTETLLLIATMMAQELAEFAEAGEEAGSDMSSVRALLDEWENAVRKHRENFVVEV